MSGNFDFMKNILPSAYDNWVESEKLAHIDYKKAAQAMRNAMEVVATQYISKNKLTDKFMKEVKSDYHDLKKVELKYKLDFLEKNGLINDPGLASKYILHNGRKRDDFFDFSRDVGNNSSHPGEIVTYSELCTCLTGWHKVLREMYKPKNAGAFKEGKMPIGEYEIYHCEIPKDRDRSHCILEYYAIKPGNIVDQYALIREYDKKAVGATGKKFLKRNVDAIDIAKQEADTFTIGMPDVEEITPYESNKTNSYLFAYIFRRKPQALEDVLKKGLTLPERLKLCRQIAECLLGLHQSSIPIYHRLLSYGSIYLCDYHDMKKGWIPYLTKFDFSKLELANDDMTIRDFADDAKDSMPSEMSKYIHPQWSSGNWEAVDEYALSILCVDILNGGIVKSLDEQKDAMEDMEDEGVSGELINCLKAMRSDERPGLEYVLEFLNEEEKKWS